MRQPWKALLEQVDDLKKVRRSTLTGPQRRCLTFSNLKVFCHHLERFLLRTLDHKLRAPAAQAKSGGKRAPSDRVKQEMSPGNTVALMFGGYEFMHLTMEIIHHPQRSTKPFLNPPWMIRICSHEQHEQPPTATMWRNWHLGLSPSARGNRHLWPWWPGSKLLSCRCEQYRILVRQWK